MREKRQFKINRWTQTSMERFSLNSAYQINDSGRLCVASMRDRLRGCGAGRRVDQPPSRLVPDMFLFNRSWTEEWPLVPGRNRWNAWFRVLHKNQSFFQQYNARWGWTFCQTPSWCRQQCPSQCCTSPGPGWHSRQHPAAFPQTCQHS